MKEAEVCIRQLDVKPPVIELHMMNNTTRRYSINKIHDYVNQKTPSITDLSFFQNMIDRDHWFSKTGREPTLRILAKEFIRAINTDLDCPLTVLKGSFMSAGASVPYDGWALLDGTHRLFKCLVTGRSTVSVVEISVGELLENVQEVDQQLQRGS